MSRTFRNRHYHWDSAKTKGSKVALDYTECRYDIETGEYYYEEPTPRERFKTFRWRHLDHHSGEVSPSWWYRNNRMAQNRRINREELFRWAQRPDEYEPLFEEDPRSCMWDWC